MNNNQFYKMPADILQAECTQKMLQEKDGAALFGIAMMVWMLIQDSREKKVTEYSLRSHLWKISSRRQQQKVYDSGLFCFDPATECYSINFDFSRTGVQPGARQSVQSGVQSGVQPGVQPNVRTQVPYSEDLEIEIELEIEGDTRETTASPKLGKTPCNAF